MEYIEYIYFIQKIKQKNQQEKNGLKKSMT